ncbi:hypothetical protein IW136_005343, partial [Coemansia sp. RSA 678]
SKYVALLVAVHAGTVGCESVGPAYMSPQIPHAVVPHPLRLAHTPMLPAVHLAPRQPTHNVPIEKPVQFAPKHRTSEEPPALRLNTAHVQPVRAHSVGPETRMAKHKPVSINDSDIYSVSKPQNGYISPNVIEHGPPPRLRDAPWPIVPADEVGNWPVAPANSDDVAESPSEKTGPRLHPEPDVRKPVAKSQSAKGVGRAVNVANKARVENTGFKQLQSSAVALAAPTSMATASVAPADTNAGNSTANMRDIPSVNGVMRMAEGNLAEVPLQDVLGDIRSNPSMSYHGHKLIRGVNIGGFLVP